MSAREDIRQYVREWLKACALPLGAALTDEQVVKAEDAVQGGQPRVSKPYLTVKVLMAGAQIGTDESRTEGTGVGTMTWYGVGRRRATVSVQGFGEETSDWLERAILRLRDPAVLDSIFGGYSQGDGIAIMPSSRGITDVASVLGDSWEPRYLLELDALYALSGQDDKQSAPAATNISIDMTLESDSPAGDFTTTITAP